MAKVFILEDSNRRIAYLKLKHSLDKCTVETNAYDANQLFLSRDRDTFDILLLDHDLGHRIFCSKKNSNTGYSFVKTSINSIQFDNPEVIIHSWNFFGAMKMKFFLKRHGIESRWKPCRLPC